MPTSSYSSLWEEKMIKEIKTRLLKGGNRVHWVSYLIEFICVYTKHIITFPWCPIVNYIIISLKVKGILGSDFLPLSYGNSIYFLSMLKKKIRCLWNKRVYRHLPGCIHCLVHCILMTDFDIFLIKWISLKLTIINFVWS